MTKYGNNFYFQSQSTTLNKFFAQKPTTFKTSQLVDQIQAKMKTLVQNDTAQMTRWQYIDHISRKNGPHSLIYMANGDKYTGEWKDDKRHGNYTI